MNYIYLLYLSIFTVLIYGIYFRSVRKADYIPEERYEIGFICSLCVVGFAVLFYTCFRDGMRLSYTNINYSMAPFSSYGIKTGGPLLSDVADAELPYLWKVFVNRDFSLWDFETAFGAQTELFSYLLYPLNWSFIFGLEAGQTIKCILEYIFAFLGLYLFLRTCGLKEMSSFIGGISYCFCSVMVMWNGWFHSDVMAFGPWLFYFAENLLAEYKNNGRLKVRYCVGFIYFLYLMLICGMPTYVPFFLYSGFIYVIVRLLQSFKLRTENRRILVILFILVCSVVLSGLMSFAYTGDTFFSTQGYQEERLGYSFHALEINYLRTIFFPYYRDGLTLHINESTLYIGPFILFWIPAFASKLGQNQKHQIGFVFWVSLVVISLFLVFDRNTGYIYRYIPLLNSSSKVRCIALFCFSGSVISAYAVDSLLDIHNRGNTVKLVISGLIILMPILVLLLYGHFHELKQYYLLFIVCAVLLIYIVFSGSRICRSLLGVVFTVCMAMFAQNYMPTIEMDASIIPEETESVQYLEKELNGGERFISLGDWTFFPQSNYYYGLSQVNAHSFVDTKEDMRSYLLAIDDDAYSLSKTRTTFSEIENYNLLSYASVKNIITTGSLSTKQALDNTLRYSAAGRDLYDYYGKDKIEQYFTSRQGIMDGIRFLFSAPELAFKNSDVMTLYLIRKETGEIAAESQVCLDLLNMNSRYTMEIFNVEWETPVECRSEEEFILRIVPEKPFEFPLGIWITDKNVYDGELIIGDQVNNGDMCFLPVCNSEMRFQDGIIIEELPEYAPRAYFADNIIHLNSYDAVLEEMKSEFLPATAIITDDDWPRLSLNLDQTESLSAVQNYSFKNDRINMDLTTDSSGMVVVTDYYDPEWKVYVNGTESEVVKTNFLFMGVPIPEGGEYHIEFRYVPESLYFYFAITLVGFTLFAIVIIFRKTLERLLNNKFGVAA